MAGFIELIAKIKPKNNGKYPLVDDVDVEMEDGSRLSEAIKKPRIPDGGTKGQILAKKSNTNGDAEWVEPLKTEDIDKKLESKLDKNLGSENSDKVLITDAEGNIITQNKEDFEGSGGTTSYNDLENKPQINGVELKGNKTSGDLKMYTQEEVDDLLYDKMDKPYKPITITDDITIEDCLDGRFKINKILGNAYQAEESDIVPTPQRPIPINSRKTTITKINPNIFDFGKENDTSNIPDSGTYRSVGQYQLKSNTKYVFSWSEATVPAKATLSFQVQDDKGTVLVSPFAYFNLESTEKKETGKKVEFTTNESGVIKFAYNCTVATSSTTETYQQYWYTKILKDISLKEDAEYTSERVELRSLKETGNIWDLKPFTDTNNTYYQSNDVEAKCWATEQVRNLQSILKPHNIYSIRLTIEMVHKVAEEGYTNASIDKRILIYRSQHETLDDVLVDICFTTEELNNGEIRIVTKTFTTPDDLTDCKILWYTERYTNESGSELFSTVKFKDITLIEGSTVQQTYIPPTVRDYKIVDHTTQTSKIVRNTFELLLTGTENWQLKNSFGDLSQYFFLPTQYVSDASNDTKNTHFKVGDPYSLNEDCLGFFVRDVRIRYGKYDGNIENLKQWLNENNVRIIGKLQTPTEEEIAYSADDVSEVGYSWQDTTSPSPTIKSEVKGVEKIDILKTGKNLFDVDKVIDGERLKNNGDGSLTVITTAEDSSASNNIQKLSDIANLTVGETYTLSAKTTGTQKQIWLKKSRSIWVFGKSKTITQDDLDSIVHFYASGINTQAIVSDIQLEVGDTATSYEPYTEQRVNITPPQPLYSTLDGSIADEVDVEKGVYRYWLLKDKIENLATAVNFAQKRGNFQSYSITKVKDNSLKPITLLGNEDTRNLICNKCDVNLSGYNNEKETFSLYMDTTAKFVGCVNIERLNENTTSDIYNFIKDFEIVYPLETPIEIPILEEDLTKLKSLKTNAGVNNIFVGGEVKPTIEARYALDIASIVSKLQTKLLTLQEEVIKNV